MAQPPSTDSLEVEVKNFGPIVEAKFDLRPLTVFIGPSNSGKSYLSNLIYALHRAWHKDYARVHEARPSYWKFPEEHFKELRDWLSGNFDPSPAFPHAGGNFAFAQDNFPVPPKIAKLICKYLRSNSGEGPLPVAYEIERCFGTGSIQPLVRRAGSKRADASKKATVTLKRNTKNCQGSSKYFTCSYELSGNNSRRAIKISPGMPFHIWGPEEGSWTADLRENVSLYSPVVDFNIQDVMRDIRNDKSVKSIKLLRDIGDSVDGSIDETLKRIGTSLVSAVFANSFDPIGRSIYYLPADRTGLMHAHQMVVNSAMERTTRAGIGRSHDMPLLSGVLADFLEQLVTINHPSLSPERHEASPRKHHRGLLNEVAADLELNVLGGAVHSKGPNNSVVSYPAFSYTPHGWDEALPLMHASSMVSELSPIVLYLRHVVLPGDVLIIEEPEAHLHPDLQVEFVNVMAGLVKAGVRIILTTHSVWVLDAVANLVLESEADRQSANGAGVGLSSQDVGLWAFEMRKRSKGSIVKEIEFDADGGGFATVFADVATKLHNNWADLDSRIHQKVRY